MSFFCDAAGCSIFGSDWGIKEKLEEGVEACDDPATFDPAGLKENVGAVIEDVLTTDEVPEPRPANFGLSF